MNNHEWQPISTAPYREPVLVTDGVSIWFGRLTRSGFVGSDLQDGDIVSIPNSDTLTGWLPAPKTMWKPAQHGHWIDDSGDGDAAVCSCCGECYDTVADYDYRKGFELFCRFYRYCPSCGAKMDEEEEK